MIKPLKLFPIFLLSISNITSLARAEEPAKTMLEDGCYDTLHLAFNDVATEKNDQIHFADECYHAIQCYFPRAGKLVKTEASYTCLFDPIVHEEMR